MPRAKYTKPPGPFPAIEQIQRSNFRFRADQRRRLNSLLPSKLSESPVPSDIRDEAAKMPHRPKVQTIADVVLHDTEALINSYLTARRIATGRNSPANVRAAIRQLREALKPFGRGWVDTETADIVPADLDNKLAAREQEIASTRFASVQRENLAILCQAIGEVVISANGGIVREQDIIQYIDAALTCARIKHPDFAKHRDRLAMLVFPKD